MTQSLAKLCVHIIFHIKNDAAPIRAEEHEELCAYIGGVIENYKSVPIKINGTENHLHVLSTMSKNIALADFVEQIKKNSSRWLKTKNECYRDFSWQGGYAGYSVSESQIATVKNYIARQQEHHKKISFHEEYVQFLQKHGINFDEQFLWK
ncbi:transposase [Planctomycetales bacterium]|nr:transposase [Planctomycetales bacterium]GHS99866.1 transposase [Planctomycetales bacterium]GHT06670.1 transposase [Planctomycetales bacterium]GHV20403.1 transposase [Planctomycetales bacterium]